MAEASPFDLTPSDSTEAHTGLAYLVPTSLIARGLLAVHTTRDRRAAWVVVKVEQFALPAIGEAHLVAAAVRHFRLGAASLLWKCLRAGAENPATPRQPVRHEIVTHVSGLDTTSRWRKGWDSNPRCPCRHAGFQDRCLKPLGHPSMLDGSGT